jgi:lycopene beta-cyclase
MTDDNFDIILVGGGLQSGLIALALQAHRPSTRIAVIERKHRLGGNHTWCFHEGDLSSLAKSWIAPLVVRRWPAYRVVFPHLRRTIPVEYAAISSDRFHEVICAAVQRAPGSRLLLDTTVERVGSADVTLDDGTTLSSQVVIDARGPETSERSLAGTGYQKFLGLELELEAGHGWDHPILMDATVDQAEGFRFMYALPLSDLRILLEDTYFSDTPTLHDTELHSRIRQYARSKGLQVKSVLREERGVLPMPWSAQSAPSSRPPLEAGYRGGWFHPGTGYSLPVAARIAEHVAHHPPGQLFGAHLDSLARQLTRQSRYCRFLNRMLFQWYPPHDRWHIFERFYRMPQATIERFYALQLTIEDRVRLLVGRPPRGLSAGYRLSRRETLSRERS